MVRRALSSPTVKRYLFNSSWMLAEQMLRIVSAVFVGIYIARYLGPEQFGILNYVLAISAFIMAITRLGMDAILVRELVNRPQCHDQLMGTAFWLMLVVATVCYLLMLVGLYSIDEQMEVKLYIAIVSISCFSTAFFIGDYFFQAEVRAKYSAICKSSVLFLMSLVKLMLIFMGAELVWFVIACLADHLLLALSFIAMLMARRNLMFFRCFNFSLARELLRSAWPMVLSAIAILVYMRIDQVMIRNMLGMQEVGLYSAATRVYEAWMILPFVMSVSLLPLIINAKERGEEEYHRRLTQLFRVLIWSSFCAALIVSLSSEWLMVLAFGEAYRASAPVVGIVMWTTVFAAIGSVSARYFNVEHMERKFALRTALAALLNVALNYLLIPVMGILGAAFATLFCTFFANYLMDWFDRDLRTLLRIKHRAVFGHPLR